MSENQPERPESVPAGARWDPGDNEWVLPHKDIEGRFHGKVRYWRPDGTLVNECEHEHGVPHGSYRRFHENGEVSREGTFVEGRLHGTDVFYRCDEPTTEAFPQGLSDGVWRAEMDMNQGRVVAGRLFDRDGQQISENGEPFPERPEGVPESATFSSETRRWLAGGTDESFDRDGQWRWWNEEGVLVREVLYRSGQEVESREFSSPFEARVVLALREGNYREAADLGRERITADPDDYAAAYWLLEALAGLQQHSLGEVRDATCTERVALAKEVVARTDGKEGLQGVFTASGRQFFEARQKALDALARRILATESSTHKLSDALVLAERAVACDHHYGNDYARATQAEILLALGRRDEAFQIVREVAARNPDLRGIAAIRQRKAYAKWLESIDTSALAAEDAHRVLGDGGNLLPELCKPIAEKRDTDEPIPEEVDIRLILGPRTPPEISAWCALIEEYALKGTYRGEFIAPLAVTLGAAIAQQDGTWLARFRSIFLPASCILLEDEEAYLAAWHPTPAGDSRVYYNHQDEWELYRNAPSISAFVTERMVGDTGLAEALALPARLKEEWARAAALAREADTEEFPPSLDVETLQARTDWLVDLFLEVGEGPKSSLARAANLAVWEREKPEAESWPHLAAYWLLSHLVFDNREELEALLAATEAHRDPAVKEIRALARAHLDGEPIAADFWNETRVRGFRKTAYEAGQWLFSAESKSRLEEVQSSETEATDAVASALEELRNADDESATSSVEFFDLLLAAAADEEAFQNSVIQQWSEGDMDQIMEGTMKIRRGDYPALGPVIDAFAAAVDARWLPILRAKLAVGAAYDEDHELAVPGMLAGLGVALGGYDAFAAEVGQLPFVVENRYGRRRRMEHALVAGHYLDDSDDPREFLRVESRRWAAQIDEWQRDTASNAFAILFEKRDPVAVEIANQILLEAEFSGANWNTCIFLAVQAGEFGIAEMKTGLQRAVERELGRTDDGDRGRVVRAFARVAGAEAAAYLAERYREQEEKWQAETRTEDWLYGYYHDDICAFLGGLLPLDPECEEWVEKAREILARYCRDDLSKSRLGALLSLLTGVVEGGLRGFGEDLARLRQRVDGMEEGELPKGFGELLEQIGDRVD